MKRSTLIILIILALTSSFVLAAPPTQPVIVSPADGMTYDTNAPLLEWTGNNTDTTSFKVVIKDAAGNKVYSKGNLLPVDVCAGSACLYSFGAENIQLGNGQFTWRVTAINADGKTKSAPATFTINFPGALELIAPDDNDTTGATNIVFEWNSVNAADQYRVKVKNTVTGAKSNSDWQSASALCGATCTYVFDAPFAAGTYKWSVEARQVTFPTSISKSIKRTFTITPQ
jgi:hypothetical protein